MFEDEELTEEQALEGVVPIRLTHVPLQRKISQDMAPSWFLPLPEPWDRRVPTNLGAVMTRQQEPHWIRWPVMGLLLHAPGSSLRAGQYMAEHMVALT